MDSNSHANLIQPIPQLTKSHGDQEAPRVSLPIENTCILPSWTHRNRPTFTASSNKL